MRFGLVRDVCVIRADLGRSEFTLVGHGMESGKKLEGEQVLSVMKLGARTVC